MTVLDRLARQGSPSGLGRYGRAGLVGRKFQSRQGRHGRTVQARQAGRQVGRADRSGWQVVLGRFGR